MTKRILSILLALAMCLSMCASAFADTSYSIEQSSQAYYTESKSAYGENALSIVDSADAAAYFRQLAEKENLTLLSVTTKSVYVEEEYRNDGTCESKFMTASEVDAYREGLASPPASRAIVNPSAVTRGKLTLMLTAYTTTHYQIVVTGRAEWQEVNFLGDPENEPASENDSFEITWDHLISSSAVCSGKYANNTSISFINSAANPYGRYCWDFEELSSSPPGVPAQYINGMVTLGLNGSQQGRTTYATLNYTHTYLRKLGIGTAYEDEWSLSITASGLPY